MKRLLLLCLLTGCATPTEVVVTGPYCPNTPARWQMADSVPLGCVKP